jgi:hypothetical protein
MEQPINTLLLKTMDIDESDNISHNVRNITVTLSTRKGVAQPWRFFFVCNKVLSGQYV